MTKMSQQCLFYYHGLKLFWENIKSDLDKCDGPSPKHGDKLFVTIFDAIFNRGWQAVQQMEAIAFQFDCYANNEAQMNRVMDSWIILLLHETSGFISSTRFQLISFKKKPLSIDSYKNSIYRRVQVKTEELNDMIPKCLMHLKHQVQIRLLKQTAEQCIVVLLYI